jgi:hypothetical protein
MTESTGILDVMLDDVADLVVASEGEHTLRVTAAENAISKAGKSQAVITFKVTDQESCKSIKYYLGYPTADDDKDTRDAKGRKFKSFQKAFGLDFKSTNEFSKMVDDGNLVSAEAVAILTVESSPDYGDQNRIKYFLG